MPIKPFFMPGPVLPPLEEEQESLTLRVSKSFLGTLNDIAAYSGHKRHRIVLTFLRWAVEEWMKEQPGFAAFQAEKRPARKGAKPGAPEEDQE